MNTLSNYHEYVDPAGIPHKFNGMISVPYETVEHRGYLIKPKLDMGSTPWLNAGNSYKRGYVVSKDHTNPMPGATWFHSILEARVGIDALIWATDQHEIRPERHRALTVGDFFWKKMYFLQGITHSYYDNLDIRV